MEWLTKWMMVTVLVGLFCGVGCKSVPLPPNKLWNSAFSSISSNLTVLGAPWNLRSAALQSFLRLRKCRNQGRRNRPRRATYRSKIFFTCIFRFFSSSFAFPELGPAATSPPASDAEVVSALTEVRARLAGLCSWSCADAASWSSNYALSRDELVLRAIRTKKSTWKIRRRMAARTSGVTGIEPFRSSSPIQRCAKKTFVSFWVMI